MPLAICDRCGFEYHLSELRKEWTGLMVCDADYDPKPRDMTPPKLRAKGLPLRNARPEPEPIWVSPEVYLYGASAAQAVISGLLYVGPGAGYRPLSGSIAALGSATGTLRTVQSLTGTAAGVGTVVANMRVAVALSGAIAGSAVLSGYFDRANALSGAIAAAGSTSGMMSVAVRLSGIAQSQGLATGALTVAVRLGAVAGTGSASGNMTNSGGTRLYTLADAPTPPRDWLDMQATSSVTYDATSKRISAIASRGSGGGSFVPPSTATAPLYNATAFNGSLPAATFNYDNPDSLSITRPSLMQPATLVYVWQEGPGVRGYEVFVDHDATSSGNRQQLFTTYGGGTPIYMVRGPVDGVETNVNLGTDVAATPNKINILVVEFNGSASRIYYNGTQMGPYDLGTVVSNAGLRIGGKSGDGATYFGGSAGEFAVLPAVFTGDAWDRVTQGTMWKWGQQANIAAGATYKNAAPKVPA